MCHAKLMCFRFPHILEIILNTVFPRSVRTRSIIFVSVILRVVFEGAFNSRKLNILNRK